MEYIADLQLFLVSVVLISLPWVVTPGSVFAVTVAKGYKSKKAGVLTAIDHGVIEFPLIFLLYFGLSNFLNIPMVNDIIGLVGGVILTYMGFQMFKTRDDNESPLRILNILPF